MNRTLRLVLIIATFLLGTFLRVYRFPDIPAGFNQDEAITGYEAHSLLTTGKDSHGKTMPAHLEGFGMGQSVLYSYLSMPVVAVFGLSSGSERAVNLIFSLLALFLFFLLVGFSGDPRLQVVATFLLALAPWHIMAARWGHEAYLFPNIFLIAALLLRNGISDGKYLVFGMAAAGITLYTYSVAHFFVPVFLALWWWAYRRELRLASPAGIGALALFIIISYPIAVFVLKNNLSLPTAALEKLSFLSIPKLEDARAAGLLAASKETGLLTVALKNLLLVFTQYDGLPYNAIAGFGAVYPLSIPFFIAGVWSAVRGSAESRSQHRFFLAWLFAALAIMLVIPVNLNRIAIIWLPLVYFTAVGILLLVNRFAAVATELLLAILSIFAAAGILFAASYFHYFSQPTPSFRQDLDTAITYLSRETTQPVYYTDQLLYIYFLFHGAYPPAAFQQLPGTYAEKMQRFGRFAQVAPDQRTLDPGNLYLLSRRENARLQQPHTILKDFGSYVIAIPQLSVTSDQ